MSFSSISKVAIQELPHDAQVGQIASSERVVNKFL